MRNRRWILSVPALLLVAASASAQQAAALNSPVLASVEARWHETFCDLTDVSRPAPGELMIRFRYRNAGPQPVAFPQLSNIVPTTRVLDPESRMLFGVMKDAGGKPLSSSTLRDIGSRTLNAGGSQSHWVRVEAPPDTVSRITVLAPGCMPMEGVEIGAKPATTPMSKPAPALASQEGEAEGVTVDIVELRRVPGAMVNLLVRYRNSGPQPFSFPDLSDQVRRFYIVDGSRRKYTVVSDKQNQPVAASSIRLQENGGDAIAPGSSILFWAKLDAPGADAKTASVTVFNAPPFDNVPIAGPSTGAGTGSAVAGSVVGLEAALKDLGARVTETEIRIDLAADVLFDFDKAEIKNQAEAQLRKVATVLKAHPDAAVIIEGHTDAKGTDAYNNALSERRAAAVKTWLTANAGANAARITTRGLGRSKPVAHNTRPDGSDNPEGRAKNRRVEIVVRKGA